MSFSIRSLLKTIGVAACLLATCEASHSHMAKHKHRSRSTSFGPSAKVVNSCAYANNTNIHDGALTGNVEYQFYQGASTNFPPPSEWISFDAMFELNRPLMEKSCGWNGWGPDNSDHMINYIKTYIQSVARASMVDHRAILAIIMQESGGCLHVPTTNNGVRNPGIMQSHNGAEFNPVAPCTTIRQMIVDGTQGTADGDGLVQLLNKYGDYHMAARAYNSGSIAASGDLSDANGATKCYASDVANRLMGWSLGPSNCH